MRDLGKEGFAWFVGVVEDREDPLKLGRVRVRIRNYHNDNKAQMPTSELPWATILMQPTSASSQKVGVSPTGITVGSMVVGFFIDGFDANQPVVMGTIFGIPSNNNALHDVPDVARGINNIEKPLDSYEPGSAYNTKYPYNKVLRTERGHVIEIDDTPGSERIHIYHKSGTYREINAEGRQVEKVVNDRFEIILGNDTIHIVGNSTIAVDGNVNMTVGGNFNADIGGTCSISSGGNMSFRAPKIDLN